MKRYTIFSILLHAVFLFMLLVIPHQKRKIPFDSTYTVSLAPPPPALIEDEKSMTKVVEEKKEEPKKIEEKVVEKKKEEPKKSVAKTVEKKKEAPKKIEKKEESKKVAERAVGKKDVMPDIETPESEYVPLPEAPMDTSENKMSVSKEMTNFNHPDYLNRVRNTINYNWAKASWNIGRNEQLLTTVSFRIGISGVITMIRVEKSSGMELYDTAALKAVQNSSPLPPLPEDYSGGYIDIFFDFAYERK